AAARGSRRGPGWAHLPVCLRRECGSNDRNQSHDSDAGRPQTELSVNLRILYVFPLAASAIVVSTARTQSSKPVASATPRTTAPAPDPRIGLRAGWFNAGEAAWNMRLVSNTPPSPDFINRDAPGDFRFINSDLSFRG